MKALKILITLALAISAGCGPLSPIPAPSPTPSPSPSPISSPSPLPTTIDYDLNLTNTGSDGIAAFQFDMTCDPTIFLLPATFITPSSLLSGANKVIQCNAALAANIARCVVYGMNQTVIPVGIVATISLTATVQNPSQPTLSNLAFADGNGTEIPTSVASLILLESQ